MRANGIAMNVAWLHPHPDHDNGATVVLVHGGPGGSLASWYLTVAPALAAGGAHVLMYDLRGHGRSERPATGYRLGDFTADLAALLDVEAPGERICLIGASLGGAIAFAYAAQSPDRLAGLATLDSGPPTALAATLAARYLASDAGRDDRFAAGAEELVRATTFAADLRAGSAFDPASLADLTCPVLAFYGERSPLLALAPEVTAAVPHAEVVRLAGAGHDLLAGTRAQVRDRLCTWTRGLTSAGVG